MRFTHVFIARPRQEAEELAEMLKSLGVQVVLQPAFDFKPVSIAAEQPDLLNELAADEYSPLLIFTSTRAVDFGLQQLPPGLTSRCRIAAIGPATSRALKAAGVYVNMRPPSGFTSEALLEMLQLDSGGSTTPIKSAVILAAPGGRRKMEEGLASLGWDVQMLMVYQREPAVIDRKELEKILSAEGILSVWTSANAMTTLSQRLPPAAWFSLCQGEWLVISDRLKRLARAYSPAEIHLSSGPGNHDLYLAFRSLL